MSVDSNFFRKYSDTFTIIIEYKYVIINFCVRFEGWGMKASGRAWFLPFLIFLFLE